MNKEKIGFWGGCFNPVSCAHIKLAKEILQNLKLSKLFFVPVGDYYEKPELEKAIHRFNMLNIATKDIDNLFIEDIEIYSSEKIYASDIFKMLQKKYQDKDIYFIMGSDNFLKMPTWKSYDEIIEKYNYIVIEKAKFNVSINRENVIYYIPTNEKKISSTEIRGLIKKKKNMEDYIHKEVYQYIVKNNLYNI